MIDSQLLAFIIVAAILTVTPGADTMSVFRNVLRGGRSDGLATATGVCCGLFVHAAFSALGISVILSHSATAFSLVKFIGAGYLFWLGIQSLGSALDQQGQASVETEFGEMQALTFRASFFEGLLTNILNPKVAIFYLAFLPQFIAPTDPVFRTSLLLASIHWAMGMSWLLILSVLLGHTRRFLLQTSVRRFLDGLCGTILIGLGIRLALEER